MSKLSLGLVGHIGGL